MLLQNLWPSGGGAWAVRGSADLVVAVNFAGSGTGATGRWSVQVEVTSGAWASLSL